MPRLIVHSADDVLAAYHIDIGGHLFLGHHDRIPRQAHLA